MARVGRKDSEQKSHEEMQWTADGTTTTTTTTTITTPITTTTTTTTSIRQRPLSLVLLRCVTPHHVPQERVTGHRIERRGSEGNCLRGEERERLTGKGAERRERSLSASGARLLSALRRRTKSGVTEGGGEGGGGGGGGLAGVQSSNTSTFSNLHLHATSTSTSSFNRLRRRTRSGVTEGDGEGGGGGGLKATQSNNTNPFSDLHLHSTSTSTSRFNPLRRRTRSGATEGGVEERGGGGGAGLKATQSTNTSPFSNPHLHTISTSTLSVTPLRRRTRSGTTEGGDGEGGGESKATQSNTSPFSNLHLHISSPSTPAGSVTPHRRHTSPGAQGLSASAPVPTEPPRAPRRRPRVKALVPRPRTWSDAAQYLRHATLPPSPTLQTDRQEGRPCSWGEGKGTAAPSPGTPDPPWPPEEWRSLPAPHNGFLTSLLHGLSLRQSASSASPHESFGSIYRRGARRWRKLYKVNGHIFQAKRFNRRAFCEFCKDRIWGLGRQGFKCTQCKLLVHKKCHKLQKVPCNADLDTSTDTLASHDSSTLPRTGTNGRMAVQDFAGEISDAGVTEETPVEMPAISGGGSEPMSPSGQAGQYCLDDFELIRVIGRGSYAKVLMVELKKTKRIYAMKVIKKTLVTDDEDIDWVQTEKHVFETASNHPFLVGLHSCFQTPSRLFFVIEFVRGGDLMFHMQRQRRLPEEHARFYAAEICLALNFLHEKGIIYRDLKLDNVLLDHEGHIKLTDYGMCKEGIRPGDTTSTFCGTPNYIAPEILQGVEYSFSVDWWALGVLLYEMLAGKSPFDIVGASDNPDCNTEDFLFQVILERPIRIPRSLSVKAASILKGFLNKNPVDRLGCHPETGFTDIISHPFFKTIIWEMLERKQIPTPFKPRVDGERDLENFDPQFTAEPVQFTPDDQRAIENIDQSEFEGFEYVNPLLMSMEDCV